MSDQRTFWDQLLLDIKKQNLQDGDKAVKQHKRVPQRYYVDKKNKSLYFTQRELDVIKALAHANTYKQVGVKLSLSTRTIEYYVKCIRTKLNCASKKQLLKRLAQLQLDEFIA